MTKTEIEELFSRPDYPEEPAFVKGVYSLWRKERLLGRNPKLVTLPQSEFEIMERFFEQLHNFNKAWGIKEVAIMPGHHICYTFYGMKVEAGKELAIVEAK